jgi:tripartite-type tricarboxylate transporter receptor subunit TctC
MLQNARNLMEEIAMPGMPRRIVLRLALIAAALVAPALACAQAFPNKPIRIIQGFAVGGNTDAIARILGNEMSKTLGQPVIIDAVVGASGRIAAEQIARAAPDGYNLLVISGGHIAVGALHTNLKFHPVDSYAPIAIVQEIEFVLSVRGDSPFKTLGALVQQARARPGEVRFGSASTGTTPHLTGELFGILSNSQLLYVPYKGDSAALTGLLTGEVDFSVTTPGTVQGQITAGAVRALATTGPRRLASLQGVPTAVEAGVAGFEVGSWAGMVAPAGTPAPIIERLHGAIRRALEVPEARARIEAFGGGVTLTSPEEMRNRMAADLERWRRVIKERNIKEP